VFSVVVNYNTIEFRRAAQGFIVMRSSDRFLAITLAVIVWLFAGYAVASRSVSPRITAPSAFDATAAVGLAIGRP
jgi:hypothetical protein